MTKKARPPERREDALSRERIVAAAVELLDLDGESGLTFRALAAHLKTGPGAIYWHVANKSELLMTATNDVIDDVLRKVRESAPEQTIRAVALGVFDAIEAHPWVGTELSRGPWPAATMQIFERIGQQLAALGVPRAAQFTTASALVSYILGVGGQNAANARAISPGTTRDDVLEATASAWENLDAKEYPFTRNAAAQLRGHDDREQFLDGIDLILAGVASRYRR